MNARRPTRKQADTPARKLAGWAAATLLALPLAAAAQTPVWPAFTAKTVNLRAGPARDYPVVAVLAPQTAVQVLGCTAGYRWCDTVVGPLRGWLYAGNIDYVDQNGAVPMIQDGVVLGVAIVGFALGDYWGHFYNDRPFYRDRDRWQRRPPPDGRGDRDHGPRGHAPPPGAMPRPLPQPAPRMPPPQPPRVEPPRPAPPPERPREVPRAQQREGPGREQQR